MNQSTLKQAALLYATLPDDSKDLARTRLSGWLRTLGLRATLEWLHDKEQAKGQQLERALLGALGLPSLADLGRRDTVDQLELARQAHALGEALHVLARADAKLQES